MQLFEQNTTKYFLLFLVDEADLKTPETGEEGGQPEISINGAAWVDTANTLVHVGNGHYYVLLTASELATLGLIAIRYKSVNTAEFQDIGEVQNAVATNDTDNIMSLLRQIETKVSYLEYTLKTGSLNPLANQPIKVL